MNVAEWAEADRLAVALVTAALHDDPDAADVAIADLDCGDIARAAWSLAQWVVGASTGEPFPPDRGDFGTHLRVLGLRFAGGDG
jgi:hypothetical protein